MCALIIGIIAAVFGFALAYEDHGDTWKQFRKADINPVRLSKAWKLTCLWGTPITGVIALFLAFSDARDADRRFQGVANELKKYEPRKIWGRLIL
jgi:hypothetical protein